MPSKKIEEILAKYLVDQVSFIELDELEEWIKNPDNEQTFLDYVKLNYAIDYNLKTSNTDKTKKLIAELIRKEKKHFKIRQLQSIFSYAAIAVLAISVLIYILKDTFSGSVNNIDTVPVIVNNTNITPGTDKATLTLGDGRHISLGEGNRIKTVNATSDGEQLVYNLNANQNNIIEYNYITIPRAGQFQVVLSDGTKVWLNSESQLKFPVNFVEGETRKVELVYGEAYFDVSPSSDHNGASFIVYNNKQEINVLGTEFNVKSYKDEPNIITTLVEGKVAINFEGLSRNLKPSQQSNINKDSGALMVKTVDVYNEISWKNGVFSFEQKSLSEIMKVLSRWYDIEVVFKNKAIENEEFAGALSKDQNIEDILNDIKNFKIIKKYEISEKKVVLE